MKASTKRDEKEREVSVAFLTGLMEGSVITLRGKEGGGGACTCTCIIYDQFHTVSARGCV